jgi:hypothetical protein
VVIASRQTVFDDPIVAGATRAPAFLAGILAVEKRGQMIGGLNRSPPNYEPL